MALVRLTWSIGVVWLLVLSCSSAWGQATTATREREALRRVQRELQQQRQEVQALKEKALAADKEKADLASDRQKLAGQVGRALARARAAEAKEQNLSLSLEDAARQRAVLAQEKAALEAQKQALEQQLAAATTRNVQGERELQLAAAQKQQLEANLASAQQASAGALQEVAMCQGRNAQLYETGMELIAKCRDSSKMDTVLRLEPFTGLKQVEIENMLEAQRDKLEVQRLRP